MGKSIVVCNQMEETSSSEIGFSDFEMQPKIYSCLNNKMENTVLQNAINQLISHHTDFNSLLKETGSSFEQDGSAEKQKCLVDGIVTSIKHQSLLGNRDNSSVIAASFTAQRLRDLVHSLNTANLLSISAKNEVLTIIQAVKIFLDEEFFSKSQLAKNITQDVNLPIEVIWMLHNEDILTLDLYITCNLSRPGAIGNLANDITFICSDIHSDCKRRSQIVDCVMSVLVNNGYLESGDSDNPSLKGLKKVSCALLDNITKKIVIGDNKTKNISVFSFLINKSKKLEHAEMITKVSADGLKKYCTRQIILILSLHPNLKVSDALEQQRNWSFAKTDPYKTQIYRELLLPFGCSEAFQILKDVLMEQEVNWEAVLTFTATLILCYDEAPQLLKVLSVELISTALEACELDGLIVGFLLARQAALEGPHVFPDYQQWFYNTFGEQNTSPANNKKSFGFLIKFLSDIVPFEIGHHLKAHIWKPPYAPVKCRPLLQDYVMLAKTRLMDLNQPIEDTGIFGESSMRGVDGITSNSDSVKQKAQTDVEMALQSYSKNGKIPASVMEASIFRKPYFVGRFLPALLTPRPLPDRPDNKMCFIDALLKTEKIPTALHSSYVNACKRISNQLLEGVFFDAEDDEMEDLMLSSWEQYERSLQSLKTCIERSTSADKRSCYNSQISVLYEKMCIFLQVEDSLISENVKHIVLDLDDPSLEKLYLQVIDSLLGMIADVLFEKSNETPLWLTRLLPSVTRNSQLYKTLCSRLLHLVLFQGTSMNDKQIQCIATVLMNLIKHTPLSNVSVKIGNSKNVLYMDAIVMNLRYSNVKWLVSTFKFVTYFLECVYMCSTEVDAIYDLLPNNFNKLFSFLHLRIKNSDHLSDISKQLLSTAHTLYDSDHFQNQLCVDDWLKMEIKVDPAVDFFTDCNRQHYYESMIFNEFVPKLQSTMEERWPSHVCTCIAEIIVHDNLCLFQCKDNMNMCIQCSKDVETNVNSSKSSITNLLQRLTSFLAVESRDTTDPWLLGFCNRLLQQEQSTEDFVKKNSTTDLICSCLQLIHQLSPYLLFVNSLKPGVRVNLDPVILFINGILKEHSTEGPALTLHTTMHILQALVQMDWLEISYARLMRKCPVVQLSIQYHWSSVRLWLQRQDLNGVLADVREVYDHSQRLLRREKDMCVDDFLIVKHPVLFSTAIVSYIKNSGKLADTVSTMLIGHYSETIMPYLGHQLLAYMACNYLKQPGNVDEYIQSVLMAAFTECPQTFLSVPEKWSSICSSKCIKLLSFVFLRNVKKCCGQDTQTIWNSPERIAVLLQCYTKTLQLYETGLAEMGTLKIIGTMVEPLNIKFIQMCHMWITENLRKLPPAVLKLVQKDIVEKCEPDIRCFFK